LFFFHLSIGKEEKKGNGQFCFFFKFYFENITSLKVIYFSLKTGAWRNAFMEKQKQFFRGKGR